MPELPEVETTRRGIEPWLLGGRVMSIEVRNPRLRWSVPADLQLLCGQRIAAVRRRAKYLLLETAAGTAIVHLGMSGSLRFAGADEPLRTHDHVVLTVNTADNNTVFLRFHDPRRFGCWLFATGDVNEHPLIASLGPEPLGNAFNAEYLFAESRQRKVAIKNFIMNGHVVVGVGNIYASEALYLAGIRPGRAAKRLTRAEAEALVEAIREVLQGAIDQGGTTLRDFVNGHGEPGYFAQSLNVYGRAGEPCHHCGNPIKSRVLGQRSTFYCSECQR